MTRRGLLIAVTILLYAMVVGGTVWGLVAARRTAMAAYTNVPEQAAWDEFRRKMDEQHVQREAIREEIARESGQPIVPRPPKSRSTRPPALELLTNHFAACLTVSVVAASGLFAVVWGMILGAIFRPGQPFVDGIPPDVSTEVRRNDRQT